MRPTVTGRRPPTGNGGILRRIPKGVIVKAIGLLLIGVLGLSSWLALRDTWEADHRDQIIALEKKAQEHWYTQRYESALAAYDELSSLVGKREIEDEELAKVLRRADVDSENVRSAWNEIRARQYYESNKNVIVTMMAQGDAALEAGHFEQAIAEFQRAAVAIRKSPSALDELSRLLEQADGGKDKALGLWRKSFLAKLNEMASEAQAASTRGEFDKAKTLWTQLIDSEKAEGPRRSEQTRGLAGSAEASLSRLPDLKKEYQDKERAKAEALAKARKSERIPFEYVGRWGYKDGNGRVVMEPKWRRARAFSDGLAVVQWGLPPDCRADSRMLATYGYIDSNGYPAFPELYNSAGDFTDGKAQVTLVEYWAADHPKVTVTSSGRVLIKGVLLPLPEGVKAISPPAGAEPGARYYRSNSARHATRVKGTDGKEFVVAQQPNIRRAMTIDTEGKVISETRGRRAR